MVCTVEPASPSRFCGRRFGLTGHPGPLSLRGTDPESPVDLKKIRQIIELMDEFELSLFHFEEKDFNIKLKKGGDLDALREMVSRMPAAAPAS